MDDRSLKALEFYHLLDILKEFSISPLGRRRCEALRPSKDLPSIQSRLAEVMELKEILKTQGDLPLEGLKDLEPILRRSEVEGTVLGVQELLDIYRQIELCRGLKRFFQKLDRFKPPRLQDKIARLSSLKFLQKEILQVMDTKGEILDRASPGLSEIRHRLEGARQKAKTVLENLLHREELQVIFQEQFITLRNGRYVLLIKSDYKHRMEGIIHDQSQSRMSFFFEPLQVIPLNNEINILRGEEKEEENRILADLSKKVRDEIQSLWADLEILGEFDLLYAMAKLSIVLRASRPILNEEGKVDMTEARHPLLTLQPEARVVPVRLHMGDGVRVLILSGANAGGKTVALKTLGLLTLMVQSGLPIPVSEGSQVAIVEDVFAVIGDEQNIEENLSTFSSHLLHVNEIVEKAGSRSLILLDELGVGTDASEGCALALGFLDRLRESGSLVVVTTHFDRLKVYGYLRPDAANAAVEFDDQTLEPKYTLSYGSSGLSNAFLVAEKLGVSGRVLELARRYRDGSEEKVSRTLEVFERLKVDTEKERLQVLQMKEEVQRERQKMRDLLEGIKRRRQEIFSQAEVKARKAIQKVEEDLKEWVRLKKEEKARLTVHPLALRRRELQEIKESSFPSLKRKGSGGVPIGVKVGERVKILSLRSPGVLVNVEEPSKQVEVLTEKARVRTSFSDIVKEEGKEEKVQPGSPLVRREGERPFSQLKVIGLTVEDALPKVDKFIDQALFHGLEKIQIIHGVGSGRLRTAIGKYLQEHRGVKSFASGDIREGGRGITVVELR
jgi:DNA mismatch repair protein MutS2